MNIIAVVTEKAVASLRSSLGLPHLLVADVELVLCSLLAWVGDHLHFDPCPLCDHPSDVPDAPGLRNLIEDLNPLALLGGVVDGDLDAAGSVGHVDEGTGLTAGSVDGEGDAHGALHEEPIKNSSVVTVVIKPVDEPLVLDGLGCVGTPHDTLVQVRDPQLVVLLVELEHDGVKALGSVVDTAGVSRV